MVSISPRLNPRLKKRLEKIEIPPTANKISIPFWFDVLSLSSTMCFTIFFRLLILFIFIAKNARKPSLEITARKE